MISNTAELGESFIIKNNCLLKFDSSKNKDKSIKIPEGVTSICHHAFENSINVEEISLPESISTIGDFAFKGCTNLKVISISENVGRIGRGIFAECSHIGNFTFSNKFISYSFINGFEIQNDSLTFFDCTKNKEQNLYIPEGIISIGEDSFANCSKLIVVTIPQSVTTIENRAFEGCSSLCIIDILGTITNFGTGIFSNCTSLMPIKISNRLTSFFFVNGLEIHDRCLTFFDCTINKSKNITIPQSVSSIGQYAFKNCSNIFSLSFPNGLKMIEKGAFEGTEITQITIPEGVTSIERDTFKGCKYLEKINIPSTIKYIDKDAFTDCPLLNKNFSRSQNEETSKNNIETYFELSPL